MASAKGKAEEEADDKAELAELRVKLDHMTAFNERLRVSHASERVAWSAERDFLATQKAHLEATNMALREQVDIAEAKAAKMIHITDDQVADIKTSAQQTLVAMGQLMSVQQSLLAQLEQGIIMQVPASPPPHPSVPRRRKRARTEQQGDARPNPPPVSNRLFQVACDAVFK